MQLSAECSRELRKAIHTLCGLVLTEDKDYLLRDRLGPVVVRRQLAGFDDLCRRLRAGLDDRLAEEVVDAVTTRETSFFRDPHVFQALRDQVLPQLVEGMGSPSAAVRLWSAGTSNGQEAYSLAMLACEFSSISANGSARRNPFTILASDIARSALRTAGQGCYDAREIARGVSATRIAQFFRREGTRYQAAPAIRTLIDFQQLNLCKPLGGIGPFDLICCRNVLIYFDLSTRQRICQQFHALLRKDGWLLLGSAENLYGVAANFESVRVGEAMFYRKTESSP